MLFVEKFGGSSLAGVERVRCAARLIADTVRAGHSVAAVLSAQGKTTDALLSTAAHYSRSPSKRELDMLLATGEQASVALMAMTLEEMGLPAVSLTGWQAGVGTDETYGDAHIRRLSMERVRRELDEGKVVLIAGFQGVSPGNDITTLGRGGSDTTAVAAAAALRADECRIYTDVEGVFTADPRLIPEARRLSAVDSEEMLRLASLGSQVLHERSAALALRFAVPLTVLSSLVPAPGTVIRPLPLPARICTRSPLSPNGRPRRCGRRGSPRTPCFSPTGALPCMFQRHRALKPSAVCTPRFWKRKIILNSDFTIGFLDETRQTCYPLGDNISGRVFL